MAAARSLLSVLLGLVLLGSAEAQDAERYRALTQALTRAEFGSAARIARAFSPGGDASLWARKAAALGDLADFLRTASTTPPAPDGVTAQSGALRLALAADLAFGAAAIGERGLHPLLFGYPAPFTSRLTLEVDGEAFVPGATAALTAAAGRVEGRVLARGVEVVLRLTGSAPPSWHPAAEQASLRIEATLTNRADRAQRVGARLLLDVVDGFDDAPVARIGPGEALSFADEWLGDAVPRRLSLGARSVVLRGAGAPAPERALLVPLALAEACAFDFPLPDGDLPLGADSALVLYAEPRVMAPGESRALVVEIGADGDDVDRAPPVGVAVYGEPVAGDARATRVLLVLRAAARGTAGAGTDLAVTPNVSPGLEVLDAAADLGALGALAADLTVQRCLVVRPDLSRGGPLEVAFDIAADPDGAGGQPRQHRRVALPIAAPAAVGLAGRIVDPRGRPVPDCQISVRQNGRVVATGISDVGGGYRIGGLAPAPCEVLAQRQVYAEPAAKASRGDVDNILYDVVLTSETVDDAGDHRLPQVMPGEARDIVLARSFTRYSLLVVVEWDAERAYLEGVARGMRKAAEFLYAASDGHFTFGRVAIQDCGRNWQDADLWDWANNSVHPNASVAGIRHRYHPQYLPWNTAINFGRQWAGAWDQPGLYSTVVHEFGHYGFGLFDEYLGAPEGVGRGLSYPEMCRCIMGYQYSDHKICHAANHRTYTNQGMWNRRSCWEQLEANHEGERGGFFAAVTTPAERRGVTPPPVRNHIGDELRVVIRDFSTGGRDVPLELVGPFQRPPAGVPVYSESPLERRTVYHGITDGAGRLTLMGVHAGDRVSATYAGARAERVLDDRLAAARLEFDATPREGAVAPLVWFHPDFAAGSGGREFAGGALEVRVGRAAERVGSLQALRPMRRELAIDVTPDQAEVSQVAADAFAAGRATFELVTVDPIEGDATSVVDVVIGTGELSAFDGSVRLAAPGDGPIVAIASTAGPPWIGPADRVAGRVHAIASPGEALSIDAVVHPPNDAALAYELRSIDPLTRATQPIAEAIPLDDGSLRVTLTPPVAIAWFERP